MRVQEGGFIKCWGYNGYGQLGYGDRTQRGNDEGDMGASIPSRACSLDFFLEGWCAEAVRFYLLFGVTSPAL